MNCYAVRINPTAMRADIVLHFSHLPMREDVVEALTQLIRRNDRDPGRPALSRCIETICQRGLPRIEEGKSQGRIKWDIADGLPHRIGWIILETFNLFENGGAVGEAMSEAQGPAIDAGNSGPSNGPAAEPSLPPRDGFTDEGWVVALRHRCLLIFENIVPGKPESLRFAAGSMARLLSEIGCPPGPE